MPKHFDMGKKTVLCLGISTIDCVCELESFPIPDKKMRAQDFRYEGGGNAANSAVALARLGCRTKILSRVGDDFFGAQCIEQFKREEIDVSLLQVDDVPTPFSVVLVDTSQQTRTIIHCSKPALIHYAFDSHHLEDVDLLYADGRNIESYAELIKEASRRGITVALETERKSLNCSPYFSFANIIFASRRFHREYFGSEDYENNLDVLLASADIVVTTLGRDGAIVKTKESCIREKGVPLTPVDTTGAGDAFNAAFLYGLLNQHSLQETARLACSYAAESCKKLGARAGLLHREELPC